ncbi:PH domain-containing protein [Nonlabens sp. Hel1_33_55]|uniref:PH domain-containing protein n=1 Tax=Nonlabens sp. Hel1_33_55 TaxID=1336802 RepID=UPI000875C4B8|nr:PH domain-containing protein [Nonlabens sp. Hel1_33_55]SCX88910.1 PH domain-containing protein [Nonlabens sp. Hel1_33_55]
MSFIDKMLGNAGEVSNEELLNEYGHLLIENEAVEMGFVLFRDVFLFTTKRLILIDKQGLTGKKMDMKSMPYKSISRFSLETAGTFDRDAELKIWISSENLPSVSKKFSKAVDVYKVQRLLASKTC